MLATVALAVTAVVVHRRRSYVPEEQITSWAYVEDTSGRDLRVDFLRGMAMMFVIVNHIDIPSLYHFLSQERLGVVSGAELFVILAGIVLGMLFRRRSARFGWVSDASRLVYRARKLYIVAIIVVVSVYALSFVPGVDAREVTTWTDRGTGIAYELYPDTEYIPRFIANVVLLRYGPFQFNIMGLYVVLLLAAPLVLLQLMQDKWIWVVGLSWILYIVHSVYPIRMLPSQFEDPFQLLAWQILFVHGLVIGYYRQQILAWMRGSAGKVVLMVSLLLFLVFLFYAWNNPWRGFAYDVRFSMIPADTFYAIYERFFDRASLGIGRLVNTAVLLVVLYALLTRFWRPIARLAGWFFVPLGQATLYIFIIHVYLALVIANIPIFNQGSILINTFGHTLILMLLWLMVKTEFLFRWIPR